MKNVELLKNSVEELRMNFKNKLILLRQLSKATLTGRAFDVRVIISSACSTGTSVYTLGENPEYFYSEMMMLSRSFIEKLTNFCYLQICDDSEYERYQIYPLYRVFHNSNRSKHTSKGTMNIIFSGKDVLEKDLKVQRALKLFSETNPRMNWSIKNIDERISLIAEKTNLHTEFFLMNTLTIYTNASEALHGSLLGCVLATGAYSLGLNTKNIQDVYENLYKNTALLYVQLGSIIHEVIKLLSENNLELFEESNKTEKIAVTKMEQIFKNPNQKPNEN